MKKQAEDLIKRFLEKSVSKNRGEAIRAAVVSIELSIEFLDANRGGFTALDYAKRLNNLMSFKFMLESMLIFE